MIPQFPQFKKIEISDYEEIKKITSNFLPYNDFEFLSLWTYNAGDLNEVSRLNGNMALKIQDFVTGEFFYSYIGTEKPVDTITKLLDRCLKEGLEEKLYLIPEANFSKDTESLKKFTVEEDEDSADYILSVDKLSELPGSDFHEKRNMVNAFKRNYPKHTVELLKPEEPNTQQKIIELFYLWEKQKSKKREDTQIELTAIERLFDVAKTLHLLGMGIFDNNQLVGFSIFHLVNKDYAILSFEKGNTDYKGIYEYINHHTALHLKTVGCKYINYEQDLGIEGLRKAKKLWRPEFFLKKYTVSRS